MKVLVIGGTRFIGYQIVRRLLEEGHEVLVFNRGITDHDINGEIKHIQGNRKDYKDFYEKLHHETFDAVVDVIAFTAEDSQAAVDTFQKNVGHYIHISTAAVYTVTRDFPCPLKEQDFDRDLYPRPAKNRELWDYGYHKRQCEEVLRKAFQEQNFPVTMYRLPMVMGERDYTLRAYSYFLRIQDNMPLILPDGGLNVFTHVYQQDVVNAVVSNLLNETSFGKAYNLAQEEIVSLRGFVQKAASIMKCKLELVDIPSRVLERARVGLSFSPLFMKRPFVLQTTRARRELNFSATPFDIWLRKTIKWFAEEYEGGPPENYSNREKEVEFALKFQRAVNSIV